MMTINKFRFLISLVLFCVFATSFGAEPNKPEMRVQFEIKEDRPPRALLRTSPNPPAESTHFAPLFIKGNWFDHRNPPIDTMLSTSSGKAMSPKQKDLISNQSIQVRDNNVTISNYTYFQIYGVSENDTEKMVEAFIKALEQESKKRKQSLLKRQQTFKEEIDRIEKRLLQKEKEAKATKNWLEEIKRKAHYLSVEEANKSVQELNRTLDELNIEIVGIQVKLEAIEEEHNRTEETAMNSSESRRKSYETMIWPRLEQMRIDEIIALKVAEAKKAAAESIRNRAEELYNLNGRSVELDEQLGSLRKTISAPQDALKSIDRELSRPDIFATPLKVFQNKVTIYPVAGIARR